MIEMQAAHVVPPPPAVVREPRRPTRANRRAAPELDGGLEPHRTRPPLWARAAASSPPRGHCPAAAATPRRRHFAAACHPTCCQAIVAAARLPPPATIAREEPTKKNLTRTLEKKIQQFTFSISLFGLCNFNSVVFVISTFLILNVDPAQVKYWYISFQLKSWI